MTSIPISDLPWPRDKVLQSLIASSEAACVFVIAPAVGQPVHIGLSRIPRRRMWQLRSEIHRPTHIFGMAWALDVQAERLAKAARAKLASKAMGGNWFSVTPQAAIDVVAREVKALKVDTATHGKFLSAIERQHKADDAEYDMYWPDLDLTGQNREDFLGFLIDEQEVLEEEETAGRLIAAMTHQFKTQAAKATA